MFSCIFSGTNRPISRLSSYFFIEWANPKSQDSQAPSIADDSPIRTSFIDLQSHSQAVPKLEDFLGESLSMVRYSDSQTETQDSSLTQIYDPTAGSAYFADQQPQDLKGVAGFQAFSANSGASEVDDSASIPRSTQFACAEFAAHSIESSTGNELTFSSCPTGSLTLGVTTHIQSPSSEKAIVPVHSDSSKKVSDTFGQRTSIYRGVTR